MDDSNTAGEQSPSENDSRIVIDNTPGGGREYVFTGIAGADDFSIPAKYFHQRAHRQVDHTLGAYRPPQGDQAARYKAITLAVHQLGTLAADLCPDSAELTLALRDLESFRMRANQAIAVNEVPAQEESRGQ